MTTPITMTSRITVEVAQYDGRDAQFGNDELIAMAARVSVVGGNQPPTVDEGATKGLINYLLKHRHASPFRHGGITFYIHAPIFVLREAMRHHVGVDWNEESARYKVLEPAFWTPDRSRPIMKGENYKAARPTLAMGEEEDYDASRMNSQYIYSAAYNAYQIEVAAGIVPEVARRLLPVAIYSSVYATFNPNAIMNFLSLRTDNPDADIKGYPQQEIQVLAEQIEDRFAQYWPITHEAWHNNGRNRL